LTIAIVWRRPLTGVAGNQSTVVGDAEVSEIAMMGVETPAPVARLMLIGQFAEMAIVPGPEGGKADFVSAGTDHFPVMVGVRTELNHAAFERCSQAICLPDPECSPRMAVGPAAFSGLDMTDWRYGCEPDNSGRPGTVIAE